MSGSMVYSVSQCFSTHCKRLRGNPESGRPLRRPEVQCSRVNAGNAISKMRTNTWPTTTKPSNHNIDLFLVMMLGFPLCAGAQTRRALRRSRQSYASRCLISLLAFL